MELKRSLARELYQAFANDDSEALEEFKQTAQQYCADGVHEFFAVYDRLANRGECDLAESSRVCEAWIACGRPKEID